MMTERFEQGKKRKGASRQHEQYITLVVTILWHPSTGNVMTFCIFVAYAYFYIIYVLFQNMQPQTGPTDPLRLRIKSCVSW